MTPVDGKAYPTILCQANGILNVGDETRIYHGRWRNARYGDDYYAEVALATLPRDRWGAVGLFPNADSGSVWSAPIVLPEGGCSITLNADGADGMHLEFTDERFQLIEGFSGAASGRSEASGGLDCAVSWPGGSLAQLSGRPVRLRLHMQRNNGNEPRLYAINLHA